MPLISSAGGIATEVKLVTAISPAPRETWEQVFGADPFALETQSPAWAEAMCAAGRFRDASRLYETADGRILVFPNLRRARPGGAAAIEGSNPLHCGVGGLLAPGGATPGDVAAVFRELASQRVLRRSIYPNPLLQSAWALGRPEGATAIPGVAQVLDLEGGFGKVWSSRFESATRRGIRRAERRGVTVESDATGNLVDEFYELLWATADRWGARQHEPVWLTRRRLAHRDPRGKFEAMAQAMGDRCRFWVARVEDRPAAAYVVLQGANAYTFRSAMAPELARYRAGDLLLCRAIEAACEAGCRFCYMGDSGGSASLAQHKKQFGAQPREYAQYRIERLPLTAAEQGVKRLAKWALRFKD